MSWQSYVDKECKSPYFVSLRGFLDDEKRKGEVVYPHIKNVFRAFDLCHFDDLKVVILGQDPYHGPGQADGLSFSVPDGIKIPPSLQNIYKEIKEDIGKDIPQSGNLEHWADQGVLLLNSTLTVRHKTPTSHSNKGWEQFTDAIIDIINKEKEHVVFLLWGKYAQKKGALINRSKHLVLESAHPSPFSAYKGFFGTKPFSKTNTYLEKHGIKPIDW